MFTILLIFRHANVLVFGKLLLQYKYQNRYVSYTCILTSEDNRIAAILMHKHTSVIGSVYSQ